MTAASWWYHPVELPGFSSRFITEILIRIRIINIILIMNNAKQSTVAYEKELPQQIQQIIIIIRIMTMIIIETVPESITTIRSISANPRTPATICCEVLTPLP